MARQGLIRLFLLSSLSLTVFAALVTARAAQAANPVWADEASDAKPTSFAVAQYLDHSADHNLVLLATGPGSGIIVGTVLHAYRATRPRAANARPVWIETGRLKAVDVQADFTIARIETQGSALSRAFFPKFSGVMSGDRAQIEHVSVARRQAIVPTLALSYFDIFVDPKGTPSTFELKPEGRRKLEAAARVFAGARLSLLMVEGYTDRNGPANENQVESYQRALTVRQYLIDELGFDPKRVVAIGYGEAEPADPTLVQGYVEANRRIVLKAIPDPGK